jgi:predicted ATP-grasp superfamily ATP-dependent carboligase
VAAAGTAVAAGTAARTTISRGAGAAAGCPRLSSSSHLLFILARDLDLVHPRRPDVLITGGEYVGVLAAVRALRAAGYRPWVASSSPSYASLSRRAAGRVHVPESRFDPSGFAHALAEAAERRSAAVLLPGTEADLLALAANRNAFAAGVSLGVPPSEAVQQALDKTALPRLTRAAGLQAPPTAFVNGSGPAAEHSFPAVVKPARSELDENGGLRHFSPRKVESPLELRRELRALPGGAGLVQPYLTGNLFAVGGVAWGGELVCAVHYRSARIWPTDCGMISYATTIPPDRELERGVGTLLGTLGWSGIFQLQFIEAQEGPCLIDFNPRVFASLAIAVAAGCNLPAVWVELLLGRRPPSAAACYRAGVRYQALSKDSRALLAALLAGRRPGPTGLGRPVTHPVLSIADPLPTLAGLTKVGRRLYRGRPLAGL